MFALSWSLLTSLSFFVLLFGRCSVFSFGCIVFAQNSNRPRRVLPSKQQQQCGLSYWAFSAIINLFFAIAGNIGCPHHTGIWRSVEGSVWAPKAIPRFQFVQYFSCFFQRIIEQHCYVFETTPSITRTLSLTAALLAHPAQVSDLNFQGSRLSIASFIHNLTHSVTARIPRRSSQQNGGDARIYTWNPKLDSPRQRTSRGGIEHWADTQKVKV